jgi:hypothetical protein
MRSFDIQTNWPKCKTSTYICRDCSTCRASKIIYQIQSSIKNRYMVKDLNKNTNYLNTVCMHALSACISFDSLWGGSSSKLNLRSTVDIPDKRTYIWHIEWKRDHELPGSRNEAVNLGWIEPFAEKNGELICQKKWTSLRKMQ